MEKIIVKGVNKLKGEVDINSAKNSILPIIISTILSPNEITIQNIPMLEDVQVILNLLDGLNCNINYSNINKSLKINTSNLKSLDTTNELVRKMRASFLLMGPMLARFGYCKLSMPGGCNIGSRPIDLHLKGFEALGAKIKLEDGNIIVEAEKLIGSKIYLDFPSVGATINIILAAIFAEGETKIMNAAKEPHITDIANLLNQMGAQIYGAGTSTIKIKGVKALHSAEHTVIPDQIEAGTFMIAAAMTKGNVYIDNIIPKHLTCIVSKLKEMGAIVKYSETSVQVIGPQRLIPTHIKTGPYPGFPTDLQPQISIALGLADGMSIVEESIFENRFIYVDELSRMGSKMQITGNVNLIKGIETYKGTIVVAPDLRAGAALVLAGLVGNNRTIVRNAEIIERGYENFDEKLKNLGANIAKK